MSKRVRVRVDKGHVYDLNSLIESHRQTCKEFDNLKSHLTGVIKKQSTDIGVLNSRCIKLDKEAMRARQARDRSNSRLNKILTRLERLDGSKEQ